MSLLVREMETDGWVERTPDPVDARRTIVSASKGGRDLMLRSQRRRLDWLSAAISRLPVESQRVLAGCSTHLDALIAALRETYSG